MSTLASLRWRGLSRRFAVRLVAAMLVVSLPLLIVLAVLLTTQASSSLSSAGQRKGVQIASAVTLRLEDWISERENSLDVLGTAVAGEFTDTAAVKSVLTSTDKTYGDFTLIELTDLTGKVLASSVSGTSITTTGQDWFQTAATGKSALTSPVQVGDHIQWVLAQPVLDADSHPLGVLVADLN